MRGLISWTYKKGIFVIRTSESLNHCFGRLPFGWRQSSPNLIFKFWDNQLSCLHFVWTHENDPMCESGRQEGGDEASIHFGEPTSRDLWTPSQVSYKSLQFSYFPELLNFSWSCIDTLHASLACFSWSSSHVAFSSSSFIITLSASCVYLRRKWAYLFTEEDF